MSAAVDNQHLQDAKQAYDVAQNVNTFIRDNMRKSKLTMLFGLAVGFGAMSVSSSMLIPLGVFTAVSLVNSFNMKRKNVELKERFNEAVQGLSSRAKNHISEVDKAISTIEPQFGIDDINPVSHYKNGNIFGLLFLGYAALAFQAAVPLVLSQMIGHRDMRKGPEILGLNMAAAKTLEDQYGEQLLSPGQPGSGDPQP